MVTRIEESDALNHGTVLRDRHGNPYILHGIKDPELRRRFRRLVKTRIFTFSAQMRPDGEETIVATEK